MEENNLQLTALVPSEMISAQSNLIQWCKNKLDALINESNELKLAFEHAKKSKWKFSTLENQYKSSIKKISFYEKMRAALNNGYFIVPNFPIQMFAIKTNDNNPKRQFTYSYWGDKKQKAKELPMNSGEYKNPFPIVENNSWKETDGNGNVKEKDSSYAKEWDDFEFPITMAKPDIMEAYTRAESLKIFDQFGIMPAVKNEDPVIIGQIIRKQGYRTKTISFMIAWHLNTKDL